jgi:hypothetical protein
VEGASAGGEPVNDAVRLARAASTKLTVSEDLLRTSGTAAPFASVVEEELLRLWSGVALSAADLCDSICEVLGVSSTVLLSSES